MSGGIYPRFVTMCIPDSACSGGHDSVSGLLVNDKTAIVILQGELEVCHVMATEDQGIYDHAESFYPVIYTGRDKEFIFHDLLHMSAAEFFGKYPCYGEYRQVAKQCHEEAMRGRGHIHPYIGFER